MNDKLSALIDGDLDDASARTMVERLNREDALKEDWNLYCLIGDTLRGELHGSPNLVGRVMAGLDDEPTVLAPRAVAKDVPSRSLWHSLMPIAASVMGVAAVGLVASTMYSQDTPVSTLASAPRTTVQANVQPVSAPAGSAAHDAHSEYLFVHQAMTRGGPMPAAVQYVRTVSTLPQEGAR